MSKYNKTVLTNSGMELVTKANKGQAKFTITKAATSTEDLSSKSVSELQALMELPSIMQYGEIWNVEDAAQDKDIVIGVDLRFNNKGLANKYNINTVGLYAKEDNNDKEILYAIATAIEPETMPDFKDKVLFKFDLTTFVVIGQMDSVTVNVNENGVVTKTQLATALAKKDDIKDVDYKLSFKANKADVDDALNNKANSTDVYNKTSVDAKLAKKVSSVDGNTPDENGAVESNSPIDVANDFDFAGQTGMKNYFHVRTKNKYYVTTETLTKLYGQIVTKINGITPNADGSITLPKVDLSEINKQIKTINDNLVKKVSSVDNNKPDLDGNVTIPLTLTNPTKLTLGIDLDTVQSPGVYIVPEDAKNAPDGYWGDVSTMIVTEAHASYYKEQIFLGGYNSKSVIKYRFYSFGWHDWQTIAKQEDVDLKADKTDLASKADKSLTYSKDDVNSLLNNKANTSDVYNKTDTNGLLDNKVSSIDGNSASSGTTNVQSNPNLTYLSKYVPYGNGSGGASWEWHSARANTLKVATLETLQSMQDKLANTVNGLGTDNNGNININTANNPYVVADLDSTKQKLQDGWNIYHGAYKINGSSEENPTDPRVLCFSNSGTQGQFMFTPSGVIYTRLAFIYSNGTITNSSWRKITAEIV